MASTLRVTHILTHQVLEEVPAADTPAVGKHTISYSQFNQTLGPFDATTTPPASQVYAEQLTGTQTLDFTALVRSAGATPIDATGQKLQSILVINLSTTDAIDVEQGAGDPYVINDADDIQVPIGGTLFMAFNDKLADVSPTVKDLLLTIAGGESANVMLIFG
jgi:hypothetical protein